jgi:hypothetical protein
MHPYLMSIPHIEAVLLVLYSSCDLDDEMYAHRAALARTYHDRTGKYFAARFY